MLVPADLRKGFPRWARIKWLSEPSSHPLNEPAGPSSRWGSAGPLKSLGCFKRRAQNSRSGHPSCDGTTGYLLRDCGSVGHRHRAMSGWLAGPSGRQGSLRNTAGPLSRWGSSGNKRLSQLSLVVSSALHPLLSLPSCIFARPLSPCCVTMNQRCSRRCRPRRSQTQVAVQPSCSLPAIFGGTRPVQPSCRRLFSGTSPVQPSCRRYLVAV